VKDQLKGVVAISSSFFAFAALRNDGTVVTWGYGGKAFVFSLFWFFLFLSPALDSLLSLSFYVYFEYLILSDFYLESVDYIYREKRELFSLVLLLLLLLFQDYGGDSSAVWGRWWPFVVVKVPLLPWERTAQWSPGETKVVIVVVFFVFFCLFVFCFLFVCFFLLLVFCLFFVVVFAFVFLCVFMCMCCVRCVFVCVRACVCMCMLCL